MKEELLKLIETAKKYAGDYNRSAYARSNDDQITQNEAECRHRQLELGRAQKLLTKMITENASEYDLKVASEYFLVILDAVKHNLKWNTCHQKLGIRFLENKYGTINLKYKK